MNMAMILAGIMGAALFPNWGYSHFAYDEKISGPYRLQAVDNIDDVTLSFADGEVAIERISSAVFEVGFDYRYIVAARHPYDRDGNTIDKSVTEYYYIIRARDGRAVASSASVRGPFDAASFAMESRRINLPPFRRMISRLQ